MVAKYLDSGSGGASVIYGTSSPLSVGKYMSNAKKRRKGNHISLSVVSPVVVEINRPFDTVVNGIYIEAGGFQFQTPDGLLTITNVDAVHGLSAGSGYGIILAAIAQDRTIHTLVTANVPV